MNHQRSPAAGQSRPWRGWAAWVARHWPGFGQGGYSLSRQLLLWVLLPQIVLWLGGGVAAYHFAAGYANDAIDASLLQASRALARQLKPVGSGLLIDFPKAAQDVLEADPNDRLYYMVSTPPGRFILGNQTLPAPPASAARQTPAWNEPLFYNGEFTARPEQGSPEGTLQKVRIAAIYLQFGDSSEATDRQTMLVQVARSIANREELARRIWVDMLLPLFSLVFLMTLIVWLGIRAGLAPLTRLRQQMEGRAATDLTPLQLASAPRELWSLATALNTLLEEVRQSVERQKRFTADAAHQLRTPLAGLKSQTELALEAAADPALRQRLQRVHDSATRSAHLVAQLLTLARSEPGTGSAISPMAFDLRLLAQQLTAQRVPRALQNDIDLGLDESDAAAAGPVWVSGNPLLLREALANVVDNALQYAGPGSEITVRVARHDQTVTLSVTDSGPGIPDAEKARVFERFHRATEHGNGCGLGLAIVREIVERHAGHVSLHDAQPHGLEVRMMLTAVSGPAPAQPPVTPATGAP